VKIKESLDLEQAMATAEKMAAELDSFPKNATDIVPGVSVAFDGETIYLIKDSDKYRKDGSGPWIKVA
jgi:hypothetical protein